MWYEIRRRIYTNIHFKHCAILTHSTKRILQSNFLFYILFWTVHKNCFSFCYVYRLFKSLPKSVTNYTIKYLQLGDQMTYIHQRKIRKKKYNLRCCFFFFDSRLFWDWWFDFVFEFINKINVCKKGLILSGENIFNKI